MPEKDENTDRDLFKPRKKDILVIICDSSGNECCNRRANYKREHTIVQGDAERNQEKEGCPHVIVRTM